MRIISDTRVENILFQNSALNSRISLATYLGGGEVTKRPLARWIILVLYIEVCLSYFFYVSFTYEFQNSSMKSFLGINLLAQVLATNDCIFLSVSFHMISFLVILLLWSEV